MTHRDCLLPPAGNRDDMALRDSQRPTVPCPLITIEVPPLPASPSPAAPSAEEIAAFVAAHDERAERFHARLDAFHAVVARELPAGPLPEAIDALSAYRRAAGTARPPRRSRRIRKGRRS